MNIALCDDEGSELEYLRRLVDEYGRRKQISFTIESFPSGEDLLSFIREKHGFDIIFLDVFMGASTGVLIARQIREFDKKCSIIFATNSRDHAIEGYGVRALQYLLKPIGADALAEALDQAIEVQLLKETKVIYIKTRQGDYRIPLEDILYAESDARIVTIHRRAQEKVSFYERLDTFESQCQDERFLRCHKSFLVNLEYVHAIANNSVIMETGQEIAVSIPITQAKKIFASYTAGRI
ncbi:MAG: LytTR family DNA-binding domain-containing protein [Treponemataceae bacterium]